MRWRYLSALLTAFITTSAAAQSVWWPTAGSVILGGGRLEEKIALALVDRVIALAGGPDALIVIIPTASEGLPPRLPSQGPEPQRIRDLRHAFEQRGARQVVFLHTRDRRVANSEAFVTVLRSARAVFLPGGASRVLDLTYHGTLVERELKALLARGGVLAGDSAGAITLGCFWLSWDGKQAAMARITEGLCALPGVTVSPHIQRIEGDEQTADIASYLVAHPTTVGINLAENTVLVLRDGTAEVIGSGSIAVFDPTRDKAKPYLRLSAGPPRSLTR